MITLSRIGQNHFNDDEGISMAEISAYTPAHLTAMTEDASTAQFSTEIAATATLFNALDLEITSEATKLGIQKARTQAKRNFRDALPNKISQLYGAVLLKFGQNSAMIAQFFPEGREVFGDCTDALLDNKLSATSGAMADYESDNPGTFDAPTLAIASGLVGDWGLVFGQSTAAKGSHETQQDIQRAAKQALGTQLHKNLLRIATVYAGPRAPSGRWLAEEKIEAMCPQHLLEDHPEEGSSSSSGSSESSGSSDEGSSGGSGS